MRDERLAVLRLIQEEKISVEEGLALLEALDGGHRTEQKDEDTAGKDQGRGWNPESIDRAMGSVREKTEVIVDRVEKVAQGLAEDVKKNIKFVGTQIDFSGLRRDLVNLTQRFAGFSFEAGRYHTLEEELSGRFSGVATGVEIDLETHNGNIAVESWSSPDYKLVISKRIAAPTAMDAKVRAEELVEIHQTPERLSVIGKESNHDAVNIRLWLPQGDLYQTDIRTKNGRVEVRRLRIREANLRSTNGKIDVEDCHGSVVTAHSVNGNLELYKVTTPKLEATTLNGRVNIRAAAEELMAKTTNGSVSFVPISHGGAGSFRHDLSTTNGSVRVELPQDYHGSVAVDAKSVRGKVQLEGSWLTEQRGKSLTGESVRAQMQGFAESERQVTLNINTVNGGITVLAPAADDSSETDTPSE